MKRKLLLAVVTLFAAVFGGGGNLSAQTDVTSTYLTNANFEGTYSSYSQPKSDRDIYQPDGWTISYTNGEGNDMTSLNSSCSQYNDNFSSEKRLQPANGGNNTYWTRFRWGDNELLTLSQETKVALPVGVYRLSADAYFNNSGATVTIGVAGKTVTVNRNAWGNYAIFFTITESAKVTVSFSIKQNSQVETVAGFDNFKLESFTQGASDITVQDWTSMIANASFENGTEGSFTGYSEGWANKPVGFSGELETGWTDGSINTTAAKDGSKCYNLWSSSFTSSNIYQNVILPKGKYKVSAALRIDNMDYVTDQGVYAKIGDNTYKSGTITSVASTWNSVEGWNTLDKVFYVTEDNTPVRLGVSSTGTGSGQKGWYQLDNFTLKYYGAIANTPYTITPEVATAATADTWYAVNISADGDYKIISSVDNTVSYTQNGSYVPSDVSTSVALTAGVKQVVALTTGTLYVKASAAATLTIAPDTYTYTVGNVTATSIADNTYLQSLTTVTFTLGDATSNDGTATLALQGTPVAKLNNGSSDVADGALTISGNVVTATYTSVTLDPSKTYTITLPANAVAWDKNTTNKNTEKVITFQTPAVFNGKYYIANTAGDLFVSRGGNGSTEAILDKYGLPVEITTNAENVSYVKFLEGDYYLYAGSQGIYSDKSYSAGGNNIKWTIASYSGGYSFKTDRTRTDPVPIKNGQYMAADVGAEEPYYTTVATYSESAYAWTLKTKAERDAIVAAYPATNKSNVITAAGISTTAAEFESYLTTNYAAVDKTASVGTAKFTGSAGDWTWASGSDSSGDPAYGTDWTEAFEKSGTWSQTISNLPAGIYKVTVNGFERKVGYAVCNTLGADGYEPVTAYFKANDEQTALKSWFSDKDGTSNPDNTSQAATAFNNDKYKNTIYTYVADAGEGKGSLTLTIGKRDKVGGSWVLFNNVTLTYYNNSLTDEQKTAILAEATTELAKPMKPSLYQALATAKTTFEGAETMANYNALRTAIDNTATSIASYAAMNTNYLAPMAAVIASSNVIDQTSSAYTDYVAYKAKYDNYTNAETADIENATANALTLWQGTGARYTNIGNILMATGWQIGGADALTDGSGFYANVWSTENAGTAPAADFARPFYEMWVSSGSIPAATLSRTVTGLTANKVYSVSANVRVQYTSKVDGSITMQVGDGDAVDVTAGSKIGETNRYIDSFTAYGMTDGSGNLTITFTVAEGSGISWLAFRDVNYAFEAAYDASAKMSIGVAKWATFCAPFAVAIPDGVTAYKVTGVTGNALTKEVVETTISAHTPVLLNSETPVNKTFYGLETGGAPTEGLLTGVYAPSYPPTGSYVLQNQDEGVNFYQVAAGEEPIVGKNRAYLTTSTTAKMLSFTDDDEATAIADVKNGKADNNTVYNISGQRVDANYKGVVIKNGKKIYQK